MFTKTCWFLCCCLFAAVCCLAEDPESRRADGFVYVAPGYAFIDGAGSAAWQAGGGGEATLFRGLGVMADVGYLHEPSGSATFSPGVMYRFNRSQKTQPFVTCGYTAFSSPDVSSSSFFHLGGGVNHWLTQRVSFRLEGRYLADTTAEYNYVFARLGFAFR